MKYNIRNTYAKQIVLLVMLGLISIIIWSTATQMPAEKKIYIIAVLFLVWFLKFIFFDTASLKNKFHSENPASDIQKKIEHLQKRFEGVIAFLKKTLLNKQGKELSLARLPWYLVIGPTSAGKTTLLAKSNINFILARQFKQNDLASLPPSDSCDWWVTRDLVLVDVPGSYLTSKEKQMTKTAPSSTPFHFLWKNLLTLIKNFHGKNSLQGVIIALHLPELAKQQTNQQRNQIIYDVKKRMLELRETFGKDLPFYFVITKCDLIPGFIEFFSECSSDELAQAWGISLSPLNENEKLIDIFIEWGK